MTRSTFQRESSPQPQRRSQRIVSPSKKDLRSMAGHQNNGLHSDAEGVEKPVREQLKKTNINAAESGIGSKTDVTMEPTAETDTEQDKSAERGRYPQKKRSFEEDEDESSDKPLLVEGKHRRKRSRDSTIEEDSHNNGGTKRISGEEPRELEVTSAANETHGSNGSASAARSVTPEVAGTKRVEVPVGEIASPKTKRSRLHSSTVEGEQPKVDSEAISENNKPDVVTTTEPKGSSNDEASANSASSSGFGNTSAVSPFGNLAGASRENEQSEKAPSPFAASGFGALSNSNTSGFGAIGKSSGGFGAGGSFATGGKSPLAAASSAPAEPLKSGSTESAFGGALGQKSAFSTGPTLSSGFGSTASGFGKVGQSGGFGSGLGGSGFGSLGGGGLSSFASGKPSAGFASNYKSSRGFGALAEDEEDEADDAGEDDDGGIKSPLSQQEDKQDERFYHQEVETGEEGEEMLLEARAKLYNFATNQDNKKEWRERGLGMLRLNVKREADSKVQARFLMRADGSRRVVLNTPVVKDIKFGAPNGSAPQNGLMYFMGTIDKGDGKASGLELLQLKMRQQYALEFYDHVVNLQSDM